MNILYLQQKLVGNSEPLAGRRLVSEFSSFADSVVTKYLVYPDDDYRNFRGDSDAKNDLFPQEAFYKFDPAIIYIEGGITHNHGEPRISTELLEAKYDDGAVVVFADNGPNEVDRYSDAYRALFPVTGATVWTTKDDESVYLVDQQSYLHSYREIKCLPEQMAVSEWLRPVYDGVDHIVASFPLALRYAENALATGNKNSTGTFYLDREVDHRDACAFACVTKIKAGYAVFIAAGVSHDRFDVEGAGNIRWIKNFCLLLHEKAKNDRSFSKTHLTSQFKLFISHRTIDKPFVRRVSDEIKNQGVGVWFDDDELVPSLSLVDEINRGLGEMTHFVLFWSKNCRGAPWVNRELNVAVSQLVDANLPIFVVRLDETSVPPIISDLYRIEAVDEDPASIGKLIAKSVEQLDRRKKADG